jgi:hypothetical protein
MTFVTRGIAAGFSEGSPCRVMGRAIMIVPLRIAAAFAVITLAPVLPAAAQQPSQPQSARIDRNGVLILVRSTLLALDHANRTGNYTVLRDLGSPGFQANTAARLSEIFAKLRNDKLDLSGVAVIEPQLSLLPQIEANGMMRMSGFFPSVPSQVNFDLAYAPVDGQWRLFGISVSVGQAVPAAPGAAAANAKPSPSAARQQPAFPHASSEKGPSESSRAKQPQPPRPP